LMCWRFGDDGFGRACHQGLLPSRQAGRGDRHGQVEESG
jgi:hypothetical protein